MNYVYARVFQMIPLDADGTPNAGYDADHGYGYMAWDDDDEVADYGFTREEAMAMISPEHFLEKVARLSEDLYWSASEYGAVLFGVHYSPAALGVSATEANEAE